MKEICCECVKKPYHNNQTKEEEMDTFKGHCNVKTDAAALMRSSERLWRVYHLITMQKKEQNNSFIGCTDLSTSPLQYLNDLQGAFRFCMEELPLAS